MKFYFNDIDLLHVKVAIDKMYDRLCALVCSVSLYVLSFEQSLCFMKHRIWSVKCSCVRKRISQTVYKLLSKKSAPGYQQLNELEMTDLITKLDDYLKQ